MSEIVNSGRVYIAAKAAVPAPVEITHFVLANIDGLDYTEAVDLDEVMPDVGDIVATLPVTQDGYITAAKVVYSLIMNSSVGPFEFNWIGLKSATGELIAVQYSPLVYKLKTAGGIIGNNMTRNFMLSFDNAQSLTEIVLEAEPWQMDNQLIEADETITVGTGGDYSTINEALEVISRKTPAYTNAGITVTINLLAGFVMAEQVIVDGIDLSFVTITGVDAETVITRSALTIDISGSGAYSAFAAMNGGRLPIIDQLFDMDTSGTSTNRFGLRLTDAGSVCNIKSGSGIKNVGWFGAVILRGAVLNADGGDFSGCGTGVSVGLGGRAILDNANISNCSTAVTGNGSVSMAYANATNASVYGIRMYGGGEANVASADFSGAPSGQGIIVVGGSIIRGSATGSLSQTANIITTDGLIIS